MIGQKSSRRTFLATGVPLFTSVACTKAFSAIPFNYCDQTNAGNKQGSEFFDGPTHSIEPVVGDGKWISRKPPEKPAGHYEPRLFDVEIGLEALGKGNTSQFLGATVVPIELPEQKIKSVKIQKDGCEAEIQPLSNGAARLMVGGSLIKGQKLAAKAVYRLEIYKSFHGYSAETLSATMRFPTRQFGQWLGNSPGIQTHSSEVSKAAKELSKGTEHPFEIIGKIQEWVFKRIKGRPMSYTSVTDAIRKGIGDCEERAGTFVAICRSIGIPARLVWVPNHAWAECCLLDKNNQPCWIPVHTAAYTWLGWTGAHELVLQKGDRITLPNNRKKVRLVSDWMSWKGAKPQVSYTGTIKPVANENSTDAGPGSRLKDRAGKWNIVSTHPDDKYLRR